MNRLIYKNCILCGELTAHDFCKACLSHLPRLTDHNCLQCAKNLINQDRLCGTCLSQPPAFDTTIAVFNYTFPIDKLLHALKYRMQLTLVPILANLLVDKLKNTYEFTPPDIIVPVPLHADRLQERGFNQALELARYVAKQMNITLLSDCCKRTKNTRPQTELPWKMRGKNVKKAFSCTADLSGKNLVIMDDVMTTGATLNELARQLRRQGAKTITNWVIARTQTDIFQTNADY